MEENSDQTPEEQLEKSEFQLKNEDFPVLQSTTTPRSSQLKSEKKPVKIVHKPRESRSRPSGTAMSATRISSMQVVNRNVESSSSRLRSCFPECLQPGSRINIPIYPDGTVKNIPPTMMTDQFGMLGFLSAYRGMQVNPTLATLAIGQDPVNMGLGMNNQLVVPNPSGYGRREIHLNYGGPWADKTSHTLHTEIWIPDEYRTNLLLGEKLAKLKFPQLEEDALFYLFYNYPGEQYQIAAAYELYARDWRYHKIRCAWLRRFDYSSVVEYTNTYERGLYHIFDPFRWRKLVATMVLSYEDLENKPTLPPPMKIYFDS
ncbi:unnamed protein product [Litomosoides sigmodontis]|uniref:NOT2/NOT3/NOT5 C-terminal domain-containing protein n=1 Tax=Litomosoides sigmodontis TaxID=42156 RepID=A0A3P6UH09_LITSI|nr:unnamed protein product [Litomosoides sigmodontis]